MELARGLIKKAKINDITACWKTTKKILYIVLTFIARDKLIVALKFFINKCCHRRIE